MLYNYVEMNLPNSIVHFKPCWGGFGQNSMDNPSVHPRDLVKSKEYRDNSDLYELFGQVTYEPRHEKTSLQGLRPGKTQTGLLSYRD